jgi:hypothetical protein
LNLSAITPANKININCGSVDKSTVKEINNGSRVISEKSQGYAKPVIPSAKLLNTDAVRRKLKFLFDSFFIFPFTYHLICAHLE